MGRRRPDIRGEQELEAAADTIAVDGGDDGLGERAMLQQRMTHRPRHVDIRGQVAAHVRARAKGPLTGAGEDDAAVARPLERIPPRGELRHHLPRHGVAAGLVVDGDDHDVRAALLDADLHVSRSPVPA